MLAKKFLVASDLTRKEEEIVSLAQCLTTEDSRDLSLGMMESFLPRG
jgi:hypothetical protein